MKKSKILGIGLGCAALTAVAIATPVIATSCSSEEEKITPITAETAISKTFAQVYTGAAKDQTMGKLGEDKLTAGDKKVSVQTGKTGEKNNEFVGLVLSTKANEIVTDAILKANGFDETKTDADGVKVEWTFNNDKFEKLANNANAIYSKAAVADKSTLELTAILRQTGKETKSIKITVTFNLGDATTAPDAK